MFLDAVPNAVTKVVRYGPNGCIIYAWFQVH
jgi:hypothetical protein